MKSLSGRVVFFAFCTFFLSTCASVKEIGDIGEEEDFSSPQIIRLASDVSENMLNASYWISRAKNPYAVKMTKSQIAKWNSLMLDQVYTGIGKPYYYLTDLRACDSVASAEEICATMQRYTKNPWYEKRDGKIHKLTVSDWLEFYKTMNFEKLGGKNYFLGASKFNTNENPDYPIKKAVCIRRSNMRVIPSDNFYSNDKDFWYDDAAQNSGILMNEPVLVLWEGADGKWLFVQSSFCTGWVHREDFAFCTDSEFERYFDYVEKPSHSFVTVTVDRLTLAPEYAVDNADSHGGEIPEFFMGTYLHTASWDSPQFSEFFLPRMPYASYLVEIPYRREDESLGISYVAFPAGSCARGLLDFNEANVLNLAFQPLGIRYGWGGMANARDCSEYLKDIFRCFGFTFPRNSRGQLEVPGLTVSFSGKSLSQKEKLLSSFTPGDVLGFPGHVMMYLGEKGGRHYVISALGSYYPKNFDGKDELSKSSVVDACSVSVNTLDVYRKNGRTWLENLTHAKEFLLDSKENEFNRKIRLDPKWKFAEFSKINEGEAIFYTAKKNRKNVTVAVNAGHGTVGGNFFKTYSHPDKSPKLTGGTNAKGAVESISISDGMVFKDGKREAEANLRTAHILKSKLLEKGYDVLMLRDHSDVQLDNVARTVISNNCADIHVAIHYDGDSQKTDKGCFYCSIPKSLEKLKNVEKHASESTRLGECLVSALRDAELPIYKGGTMEVDLTQTSYSTIPTVDIELGNQCTDTSTKNLEIRAEALCNGIDAFFSGFSSTKKVRN